jgi:hypothetical protein
VLVIAILYFALISLMLWESTEAFRSAQRFRSRIVAQAWAESGAEIAAQKVVSASTGESTWESDEATVETDTKVVPTQNGLDFQITSASTTKGVMPARARVSATGRYDGSRFRILRTIHSQ